MELSEAFKPKLATDVKIRFLKEDERGKFYIIVRRKKAAYLKIHQVGKNIIEMLDGNTTIQQIRDMLKSRDVEVDLSQFIMLLGEKGFLENYPTPRSIIKEERLRVRYIPLIRNFEGILSVFSKIISWVFKKSFFILFLCINLAIAFLFVVLIFLGALSVTQIFSVQNSFFLALMLYLFVIIPILGILHELAHAVACYYFGGKPSEIGIALYLFTFFFYTDTSDVWLLDKKKSSFVFLAGPLMTLFIGNVCFVLSFLFLSPISQLLIMLAFGAYISVLFGFDPLIESDGYYILQSIVVFPNLHSHAWSYITSWLKYKLGLLPKIEYQEFITTYSKNEQRILKIYAPLAIIVNITFLGIIIPWTILTLKEYLRLTWVLFTSFHQISLLNFVAWAFETVFFSIAFIYSLWRIISILMRKIRNKT
jgi:putative peptide zinc metalloprotease protein